MKRPSPEEIGRRMDALGLWELLLPFNFAVRPKGTVFPYFCTVLLGDGAPVRVRFLMLEGWQTLHDYVRTRADRDFGFYQSPVEMPHLELVVLADGETQLFRYDTGFMPRPAGESQRALAARILWESYGILLRVESNRGLPMSFAQEKAVFARVETAADVWEDRPLVIPDPPPQTEKVSFPKADVKAAQDLPFERGFVLDLDFRLLQNVMTKEARPRCVYRLWAVDSKDASPVMDSRASVNPEIGLKGLWESIPPQVLRELVRHGRIPGEIRLRSGRLFRLMRPLCLELPFKLSLHDALGTLDGN